MLYAHAEQYQENHQLELESELACIVKHFSIVISQVYFVSCFSWFHLYASMISHIIIRLFSVSIQAFVHSQ